MPAYEAVCRNFQQGLAKKGIDWLPSIEISSLRLIEIYVANGYGVGLFLDVPTLKLSPELRALALPDFEPVTFGALWRGKVTPLIQCFLEAIALRAQEMLGQKPAGAEKNAAPAGRAGGK
jgi:DNA-binding transcriptional LysR family regulator